MADKKEVNFETIKEKIKELYIYGEIDKHGNHIIYNAKELGEKFNYNPSSIRNSAKNEGWTLEKNLFLEEVHKRRKENRLDNLAKEAANFDKRILCAVKVSMGIVEKYLEGEISGNSKMTLPAFERLTRCIGNLQRAGKISLGEETGSQGALSWADLVKKASEIRPNDD